jgi:hypothetical protein
MAFAFSSLGNRFRLTDLERMQAVFERKQKRMRIKLVRAGLWLPKLRTTHRPPIRHLVCATKQMKSERKYVKF